MKQIRKLLALSALVIFFLVSVPQADAFQALFAGQQTVDEQNAVAVTFPEDLDTTQPLDTYLAIFADNDVPVEGAWILSKDPATVYFPNISPDTRYVVSIYKGLRSRSGEQLSYPQTFVVKTRQVEPMIGFATRGSVLASGLTKGLPVVTLDIEQADIDFFRVKPDKLAPFIEVFSRDSRMYYYQSPELQQFTDLVYSGRWDLEINKHLRTRTNIPITHIAALQKPGVYFAVLKGAGIYDYGYSATWFSISDLGLHARKYDNALQFHVQSLETAKPKANVRVTGVDKDGRTLFQVRTTEEGTAKVSGAFTDLVLVTAAKESHVSLLPMNVPALDLSEFRTAAARYRPVELFVYGPRDIYRSGETVPMDGLLRNQDGDMVPAVPIQAKVYAPDGRMIHEFLWQPRENNYYTFRYQLPGNALTGNWEVRFSQAGTLVTAYRFLVAEFLPERMRSDISNPRGQTDILNKDQDLKIRVSGAFLYGAPAAGSKVDAAIHISPARKLFKEKWPGFVFGHIKDLVTQSFTTEKTALDTEGHGMLAVKNQWHNVSSPHWVTANVSLYDAGGRPVVRNKSWQVWPAESLVGIRSLAEKGEVDSDSIARFAVMRVDKTGRRLGAENLKVTVIKEHREYYWEYTNGAWEWRSSSQFYPEERYLVDIPDQESIVVDVPVKWGGYRLEIFDPDTGLTASYDIWAGWQPRGSEGRDLNRPDRVDLILDKKAYASQDRVQVTVKSPEGGSGYLFVESDTNLLTRPITIPPEGADIFFDLDPAWQRHDLYVSAVVVRPGESRSNSLPKRAVGLVHLPLDRGHRQLSVEIRMPAKTEPGRRITVPVQVRRSDGSIPSDARITLAAVDTGILNLTGYETPSPFDYFFQPRQYGPDIHDMYQKLIETGDGAWARQRFGGDAPTLSRGGDRPATDVQIISLHRAAVAADADGMALFHLDMPEFNGQVRLMAVAHTAADFGSGDHELTLASPLVTQMTMPRFLAAGDQARLNLDLHNLTGTSQDISLALTAGLTLEIQGPADLQLHLATDEKQSVSIPVAARTAPGRSIITCAIQGLVVNGEQRTLERSWFLETRPAYPALTTAWHKTLAPGASFVMAPARNLITETIDLRASLGSAPPIPVAEHVRILDAYPYGCLEQTVSSLFPHVILGSADMAELGIRSESDDAVYDKIRRGIQLVGEKQKSSGGFGLWDSSGPENAWLTAYAVHFLIQARQAGFAVPEQSMKQALDRLLVFVRRPGAIPCERYYPPVPYRASVQTYAAFVLAMEQSLTLGDARAVFQAAQDQIQGSLAFVHAGLALHLAGDTLLAAHAFDRALQIRRPEKGSLGDFGSDLRDLAAGFYLVSVHAPDYQNRDGFLAALEPLVSGQKWFSTQERNALVMAGVARLKTPQKRWQARVLNNGIPRDLDHTSQKEVAWSGDRAGQGVEITNTGQTDLFVHAVMSGYPDQAPGPESRGASITRRYLDMNGHPVSLEKAAMGDRLLVELAVKTDQDMPHCLVVDLLPAGMELEDPHLSGSFVIDDIMVDEKSVADWHKAHGTRHTEYRDDRFAAALDLRAKQEYRRFYGVRLVNPGRFQVPPPLVEDMYKPWIRAVGSGGGILAIPDF